MNILYTNAQSISKKIKELEVIATDEKPEVIILTESWCSKDKNSDASLKMQL